MKKVVILIIMIITHVNFSFVSAYSITNTGYVAYKYNENEIRPIASLTKIMNIMVALDEVKKGHISLNDKVTITDDMVKINETGIDIKKGDKIRLEDLLKAQVVYSANNAAYATAYYISKNNIENYIELMNAKAQQLQMINTKFYTPAGLPTKYTKKPVDVSTAYDLSKLSLEALKYDKLIEWANLKTINIKGKKYINRNILLGKDGNFGLKTGYHTLSGFNMIGLYKIKGVILINISLADETNENKFKTQQKLMNNFKKNLKQYLYKDQFYAALNLEHFKQKNINTAIASDFFYYNTDFIIKEKVYNLNKDISIGSKVGDVEIYSLNGKIIKRIDIIAKTEAKKLNIFERILEFFGIL